jgi:hypothetical protein
MPAMKKGTLCRAARHDDLVPTLAVPPLGLCGTLAQMGSRVGGS